MGEDGNEGVDQSALMEVAAAVAGIAIGLCALLQQVRAQQQPDLVDQATIGALAGAGFLALVAAMLALRKGTFGWVAGFLLASFLCLGATFALVLFQI